MWNERNTVSLRKINTGDTDGRVSRHAGSVVEKAFLWTDKTLGTVRQMGWILKSVQTKPNNKRLGKKSLR